MNSYKNIKISIAYSLLLIILIILPTGAFAAFDSYNEAPTPFNHETTGYLFASQNNASTNHIATAALKKSWYSWRLEEKKSYSLADKTDEASIQAFLLPLHGFAVRNNTHNLRDINITQRRKGVNKNVIFQNDVLETPITNPKENDGVDFYEIAKKLRFSPSGSDLAVFKTVNNSTPNVGDEVIFTIAAINNGSTTDTNVKVMDLLPSGYTYLGHTASDGTTYVQATGEWLIGTLNNEQSITLTISARVNPSGDYTNEASISGKNSDPNKSNNSSSVTPIVFTCTHTVDRVSNGLFPISEVVSTNTVTGWEVAGTYTSHWHSGWGLVRLDELGLRFIRDGGTITTVDQNLSNINSFTVIELKDLYWFKTGLPEGDQSSIGILEIFYNEVLYAEINTTASNTPTITPHNGAQITRTTLPPVLTTDGLSSKVDLGILLPNNIPSSGTLRFRFAPPGPRISGARDIGMKSVSVINCVKSDLSIEKTVNSINSPNVGGNVVFTLTARNLGPDNATNVVVIDTIPSGYTYVSDDGEAATTHTSGLVTWTIGNLANGATATLKITATVLNTGEYKNIARISGTEDDPNLSNNKDSVSAEPFRNLPVEWLGFAGKLTTLETIKLNWSTARERNSEAFIIQRSSNSIDWQDIGKVSANGDTDLVSQYKHLDKTPLIGINYYRLLQIDFDKAQNYSKVIRVDFNPLWDIRVFPNPFNEHILIRGAELDTFSWTLSDYSGRVIQSAKIHSGLNQLMIDTNKLHPELYFIKLEKEGTVMVFKLKK